jgi:hypothetical protein
MFEDELLGFTTFANEGDRPMRRDEWEFEFSAGKLAEAAMGKKAHHEDRLAFWENAKLKTMHEVKETGIEVNESIASQFSSKTAAYGPQVQVRTDLQTKLTECYNKMKEHGNKIREYDGWVQVLSANAEARLKLTADDYLYFFGIFK